MQERPITSIGTNDVSIDFGAGVVGPSTADIARSNLHSRDTFTSRIKRQIAYVGGAFSLALAACSGGGAGETRAAVTSTPEPRAAATAIPIGENLDLIAQLNPGYKDLIDKVANGTASREEITEFNEFATAYTNVKKCGPNDRKELDKIYVKTGQQAKLLSQPDENSPVLDILDQGTAIAENCRFDVLVQAGGRVPFRNGTVADGPSTGNIGWVDARSGGNIAGVPQVVTRPGDTPTAPRPEATATPTEAWLKPLDVWSGVLGKDSPFIMAAMPGSSQNTAKIVMLGINPTSSSSAIEGCTTMNIGPRSIGSTGARINASLEGQRTLRGTFKDPFSQQEFILTLSYLGNGTDVLLNKYLADPNRLPQKTAQAARERIENLCSVTLP